MENNLKTGQKLYDFYIVNVKRAKWMVVPVIKIVAGLLEKPQK